MEHVSLQYQEQTFNPVTITLNSPYALKVIKALFGAMSLETYAHILGLSEDDVVTIETRRDFEQIYWDLNGNFPMVKTPCINVSN